MSREFSRIYATFWTGEAGRSIRARRDAGLYLVAAYLHSAPTANMIGLYYLPPPIISHETGVPLEEVERALSLLSEMGFATYDPATELILVHGMLEDQMLTRDDSGQPIPLKPKDKRATGARRLAKDLQGSALYRVLADRHPDIFRPPVTPSPQEAPSEGLPASPPTAEAPPKAPPWGDEEGAAPPSQGLPGPGSPSQAPPPGGQSPSQAPPKPSTSAGPRAEAQAQSSPDEATPLEGSAAESPNGISLAAELATLAVTASNGAKPGQEITLAAVKKALRAQPLLWVLCKLGKVRERALRGGLKSPGAYFTTVLNQGEPDDDESLRAASKRLQALGGEPATPELVCARIDMIARTVRAQGKEAASA